MSDEDVLARVDALLDVGRASQAITELMTALASAPDSYPLLCGLSLAYYSAGQYEWARQVAERAISVAPDEPRAFLLASAALAELGDAPRATRAAEEAVRLAPEDWTNHVQLSRALATYEPIAALADAGTIARTQRRGKLLGAGAMGLSALVLLVVLAVISIGVARQEWGQLLEQVAITVALSTPVLLTALLLLLMSRRHGREAASALAACKIPGEGPRASQAPARRALAAAEHAVSLAPEEPETHFAVGYAAGQLKRHDAAVAAYRRVLALRPDHALALNNLSALHVNRGRLLTAAKGLRAAVAFDPSLRVAEDNLRVVAIKFITWFNIAVFALYMLMDILNPQSEPLVAVLAGACLAVLAVVAVVFGLRLPPALRAYYRRLVIVDRLFGVRVALLVAAFVITLCELLPVSASVYQSLHAGARACVIAGFFVGIGQRARENAS